MAYGEEDKGNPGPPEEGGVDVMDETFRAAAEEAFNAPDVATYTRALKEAIKACR